MKMVMNDIVEEVDCKSGFYWRKFSLWRVLYESRVWTIELRAEMLMAGPES